MKLPYHAKTRCGWDAVVESIDWPGEQPVRGHIVYPDGERIPQAWRADGGWRWLKDGGDHPLDLLNFPSDDDTTVNADSEDRIIVINGQQFRVPYEVAELIDGLKDAAPQATAGEAVAWPEICDGIEQDAFEAWAKGERFDMREHPLHYLFLDPKTDAARRAWKAGLVHAVKRMRAHHTPAAAPTDNPALVEAALAGSPTEAASSKTVIGFDYGNEDEAVLTIVETQENGVLNIIASLHGTPAVAVGSLKFERDALTAQIERLTAELMNLERAASEVARYGAVPGPQWVKLAGALISARVALTKLEGK